MGYLVNDDKLMSSRFKDGWVNYIPIKRELEVGYDSFSTVKFLHGNDQVFRVTLTGGYLKVTPHLWYLPLGIFGSIFGLKPRLVPIVDIKVVWVESGQTYLDDLTLCLNDFSLSVNNLLRTIAGNNLKRYKAIHSGVGNALKDVTEHESCLRNFTMNSKEGELVLPGFLMNMVSDELQKYAKIDAE